MIFIIAFFAFSGPLHAEPLDPAKINEILHATGISVNGQYKATFPQKDIGVTVDGFSIVPAMGLTSWAVLAPRKKGVMFMGDFVVLEDEAALVQRTAVENGLKITAMHNHFLRDIPKVMYMHLGGMGNAEDMARSVAAVLERIAGLRAAKGLKPGSPPAESGLDQRALEAILGGGATSANGAVKFVIDRPDVNLTEMGMPVTSFMGFNTWLAFEGTMEKAAVAGDFAMRQDEVERVIAALLYHKIEVTAVHNHMVKEEPRIVFLHFWATGPATTLARGLKAALDETRRKRR